MLYRFTKLNNIRYLTSYFLIFMQFVLIFLFTKRLYYVSMDVKKQLGFKIKRLRQKKGITQEQLAEMANISTRSLSGIELGENFMTAQTMESLLKCLGVTIDELFSAEHLKPTEDLISEIDTIINSVKTDRDKIENIYKVVKAIILT